MNLNLGNFGDKRNSPRMNADGLSHLPKDRRDWLEIFSDVRGGTVKVMAGTCEACVWGRGEHAAICAERNR